MAKPAPKRIAKKRNPHRRRQARPSPAPAPIKEARRQLRLHADHDALIQAGADKVTGGNFTAFLELSALEKFSRMHARQSGQGLTEVILPSARGLAQMRHLDEPLKMLARALESMAERLEAKRGYQADAKVQEQLVATCLRVIKATYRNPPTGPEARGRNGRN
jgi:hypothetical protein